MQDVIGFNDMTGNGQANFTTDRFGKNSQALNLNNDYASIGGSLYFATPAFSISLWIYPVIDQYTLSSSVNIFDSGNSNGYYDNTDYFSDDIILYLNAANSEPIFQIYYSTTCVVNVQSSVNLFNSQWHHLAATYDGVTASIYINGTLVGSVKQAYSLTNQSRAFNTFGGNRNIYGRDSGNFGQSASHLDDIRLYNISLTPNQIVNIMNAANATCKFIYLFVMLFELKALYLYTF